MDLPCPFALLQGCALLHHLSPRWPPALPALPAGAAGLTNPDLCLQELLAYISVLLALRPLPLEDQWAHQQDNKITQSAAVAVAHDAQHPAGVKKAPTKEAAGSSTRSGDSRGKAGGGQQDQPDQQQEMGMILQLDIDMEAPVITMPRNSDSSDSLQVGLVA